MAGTSQGPRYVIVMGPAGSGKNHFIWTASGKGQDRIQHGMVQGSVDLTPIECKHPSPAAEHPPIIFVDTIGFEDLQNSWLHVLFTRLNKDIKDTNGELAGIILLHQIAPNQIPLSTIHRQLQSLQDMCGMDVMKNVVVTTTMWDTGVREATAMKRHADLQAALFDGAIKRGCKLEEFRGTKDSAWKSIDYLLNQKPCPPLLVQTEMAGGKRFEHTSAAKTTKRGFWSRLFSWFM